MTAHMEDDERPRKYPKLDNADDAGLHGREAGAGRDSTMTGALLSETGGHEDVPKETAESNGDGREGGEGGEGGNESTAGATTQKTGEEPPKMSKHQLKKIRRQEQWEAGRDSRKAKRKEKVAARKERRRAEAKNNSDAAAAAAEEGGEGNEKAITDDNNTTTAKRKQQQSVSLPLTIVLDCSFDDLMLDKERTSLSSQLTRSYSDNSRAPYRAHMVVSSFDKLLKQRFETVLAKTHENWKGVRFMQEDYTHAAELAKEWMQEPGKQGRANQLAGVFSKKPDARPEDGEIIYLTSDSPETLTELKPYSTYIVGGLVDKNRHKGICYKQACERGVKTAKLPIGDYIQMASRSVLTTNHVVEIMLRWLELGDWGKAFMQVLPSRKGGVLKDGGGSGAAEAREDENGDGDGGAAPETEKYAGAQQDS